MKDDFGENGASSLDARQIIFINTHGIAAWTKSKTQTKGPATTELQQLVENLDG